ncbi:MAG: type I-C CRISPR-associated endonuclease Cas1c [Candidatus Paceibacteria bacterium]
MKKLLNTLYITKQDSYIHQERQTVVIKNGNDKIAQFPLLSLGNIICIGRVSVSPFLMELCMERNIGIVFYTEYGRFLARVQGRENGNVLLRREQYRWADQEKKSTDMAQFFVASKIKNSRALLQRERRNHGETDSLKKAIDKLSDSIKKVRNSKSVKEVRGIEGEAANTYFSVFNVLLKEENFYFKGRIKRPPTDPVNALLSFFYSIITQECVSALQGVGLDPYVGFLHKDRPGRPSLALDMLEEFRAAWADRFILTLINRKQIKNRDFYSEASGSIKIKEKARKNILAAYQERKQTNIQHSYLNEQVPIGLLPHCQAMLLARHIRDDMEFYTPFLVK